MDQNLKTSPRASRRICGMKSHQAVKGISCGNLTVHLVVLLYGLSCWGHKAPLLHPLLAPIIIDRSELFIKQGQWAQYFFWLCHWAPIHPLPSLSYRTYLLEAPLSWISKLFLAERPKQLDIFLISMLFELGGNSENQWVGVLQHMGLPTLGALLFTIYHFPESPIAENCQMLDNP